MSLYDRILGHPFVYHRVRPLVVGIDYTPQYAALAATADDRVIDIGCGGGDALNYLGSFAAYHGYDTDAVAIGFAKQRSEARRDDVHFEACEVSAATFEEVQPTCVMMNGLLHHLDDAAAIGVLKMCGHSSVRRIVTNDTVFIDGHRLNNVMAHMDRGRYVRDVAGYRDLAARADLVIVSDELVRSHPERGFVRYQVMVLKAHVSSDGAV